LGVTVEVQNIRIAHVLGSLIHGGVQAVALQLIRGLGQESFSQLVVYEFSHAGDMHAEFVEIASVRHCPYRRGRPLEFVRALARLLREETVDVVLSHAFGNHALVAIAARLAGVSKAFVVVAGDPTWRSKTWWRMFALAHGARPICNGEIAVSGTVGMALAKGLRLPSHRVTVIPNGCDVTQVACRAAKARRAEADHGGWRILMVSRFAPSKDHATLLRAVALLRGKGHPAELWLAGDGETREEHEALARRLGISGCAEFLGTRSDIAELMGTSDVLVLATESEGLPIVLLEGMAAGIPTLASDIPPCRETLDGGRCGVLVPPRNPEELAKAIEGLMRDPQRRETLIGAARQRVRDHYDFPLMVERYARLLRGG
jgi:glycosyltransferase involved in cell wall biosynthesis